MAGIRRPEPIEVFEDNIAGAAQLIALTKGLLVTRKTQIGAERKGALGVALRLPESEWQELDWVESEDVFVVLKPESDMTRENFGERRLRPLLRQSIVAIAAAVESYVAEKSRCYIGKALRKQPERLREIPVSLGEVLDIERRYERRSWGYRDLIEDYLEKESSSASGKVGIVFSTVGQRNVLGKVDGRRQVGKGTSARQLDELARRRNRIAHTGDRLGRKRATLAVEEAETHYGNAKEIVEALEAVLP